MLCKEDDVLTVTGDGMGSSDGEVESGSAEHDPCLWFSNAMVL